MLYFPRCRSQTGDREGATCDVGCIFDERHCRCRILCDMVRHPETVGTLAATCFSLKGKTPRCASAGSCCYICSRCIFDCFQYSTLLARCQSKSKDPQCASASLLCLHRADSLLTAFSIAPFSPTVKSSPPISSLLDESPSP